MEVENVPIESLVLDPKNARKGDVPALMRSLKEFGQHRAAVVQRSTRRVLIGNHMVMAASALGWTDIAVTFTDDSEEQALRRALSDNLMSDKSGWDQEQLKSLVAELDGQLVPGLEQSDLDKLLADAAAEPVAPLLPIVARPGEHYSYVMIVAGDEINDNWLRNLFGLQSSASWKSKRTGISRVVTVQQFKEAMNAAIGRGEPYD